MTTLTHRSPVISLAAERARRGEPNLFPTLSERQSMKALRSLHPGKRPRRLAYLCAAAWVCGIIASAAVWFAVGFFLWSLGLFATGAAR